MRSTHLGSMGKDRINKTIDVVGEHMMSNLVTTETLFYTLLDVVGLEKEYAEYVSLKLCGGGRKVTAASVSSITQEMGSRTYGLSSKQAAIFMKRHMKSSRIQLLSSNPKVWLMNGFSTLEKPFIAGDAREDIYTLLEERDVLKRKVTKINNKIQQFPDNLGELVQQRMWIQNRLSTVKDRIETHVLTNNV